MNGLTRPSYAGTGRRETEGEETTVYKFLRAMPPENQVDEQRMVIFNHRRDVQSAAPEGEEALLEGAWVEEEEEEIVEEIVYDTDHIVYDHDYVEDPQSSRTDIIRTRATPYHRPSALPTVHGVSRQRAREGTETVGAQQQHRILRGPTVRDARIAGLDARRYRAQPRRRAEAKDRDSAECERCRMRFFLPFHALKSRITYVLPGDPLALPVPYFRCPMCDHESEIRWHAPDAE